MEISKLIMLDAQQELKKLGISTRLEKANMGWKTTGHLLRFIRFDFKGEFELIIYDNKTQLTFGRRLTKVFPVIADPAFKPDDVVELIVSTGRYLQQMIKAIPKWT